MVHHHVLNDQQPLRVRGVHKTLELRQRAPMRIHLVKILARVAVILAAAVEDDGGNPDGRRAEGLDVIQLLLDPLEVAAVNLPAVAGIVGTGQIVVCGIAVEETVGENLVDALRPPEAVGTGLGANARRATTPRGDETNDNEPDNVWLERRTIHNDASNRTHPPAHYKPNHLRTASHEDAVEPAAAAMNTALAAPAQWVQQEFASVGLGDPRRTQRLVKLAARLAPSPGGTLPQALPQWSELKAAYRFLSQPQAGLSEVQTPHWERTRAGGREAGEYLLIEDTIELDCRTHLATQELGPIGNGRGRGLLLHTTLAVRVEAWTAEQPPEGVLVGLFGQQCWTRPGPPKRGREEHGVEGES